MRVKKICSVEGCGGVHKGRGYCRKHYNQFGRAEKDPDEARFTPNKIIYAGDHAEMVLLGVYKQETGRVLIDRADVDLVKCYRWALLRGPRTGYAVSPAKGWRPLVKMHRLVMGLKDPKILVDHINHNGLDNRRNNLRTAKCIENAYNSRAAVGKSSQFKGVYWHKGLRRWRTRIAFNGVKKYIGTFRNEIEAAIAYDRAAAELHREFACLNFPFL